MAQERGTDRGTHHTHQQLVEPLQFELRLGPHVWSQGGLQESHAPTRQHLPRRPGGVGVVVDLEMHSDSRPHLTVFIFRVTRAA